MATVAHGRMSSNNQRGTVGLSAGDWIRIKRLQGARSYGMTVANNTDVDVPTVPQTAYSVPFLKAKHTGASRIRRTNEQWISYRASQTGDYVENTISTEGDLEVKMLVSTRICNCATAELSPRTTGCKKCSVYTHKTIQ